MKHFSVFGYREQAYIFDMAGSKEQPYKCQYCFKRFKTQINVCNHNKREVFKESLIESRQGDHNENPKRKDC